MRKLTYSLVEGQLFMPEVCFATNMPSNGMPVVCAAGGACLSFLGPLADSSATVCLCTHSLSGPSAADR